MVGILILRPKLLNLDHIKLHSRPSKCVEGVREFAQRQLEAIPCLSGLPVYEFGSSAAGVGLVLDTSDLDFAIITERDPAGVTFIFYLRTA